MYQTVSSNKLNKYDHYQQIYGMFFLNKQLDTGRLELF